MIGKVDIPEGQAGEWKVEKVKVDRLDFRNLLAGRPVPLGETFTRLCRGNTCVMSDTPAEQGDHRIFYHRATGEVLMAGLGIGMILEAVVNKPEVTKVTVVELSPEVISLVWPTYKARYGDKIELIQADILKWEPPKGKVYDAVWFDIWDSICTDNLKDMKFLTRRYGKKAKWKGCWARYICQREYNEAKRDEAMFRAFNSNRNIFDDEQIKMLKSDAEGNQL